MKSAFKKLSAFWNGQFNQKSFKLPSIDKWNARNLTQAVTIGSGTILLGKLLYDSQKEIGYYNWDFSSILQQSLCEGFLTFTKKHTWDMEESAFRTMTMERMKFVIEHKGLDYGPQRRTQSFLLRQERAFLNEVRNVTPEEWNAEPRYDALRTMPGRRMQTTRLFWLPFKNTIVKLVWSDEHKEYDVFIGRDVRALLACKDEKLKNGKIVKIPIHLEGTAAAVFKQEVDGNRYVLSEDLVSILHTSAQQFEYYEPFPRKVFNEELVWDQKANKDTVENQYSDLLMESSIQALQSMTELELQTLLKEKFREYYGKSTFHQFILYGKEGFAYGMEKITNPEWEQFRYDTYLGQKTFALYWVPSLRIAPYAPLTAGVFDVLKVVWDEELNKYHLFVARKCHVLCSLQSSSEGIQFPSLIYEVTQVPHDHFNHEMEEHTSLSIFKYKYKHDSTTGMTHINNHNFTFEHLKPKPSK